MIDSLSLEQQTLIDLNSLLEISSNKEITGKLTSLKLVSFLME